VSKTTQKKYKLRFELNDDETINDAQHLLAHFEF